MNYLSYSLKQAINIILVSCCVLILFSQSKAYGAESTEFSKQEIKLSKSYTKKFCNAIAMGVSEDGALKMSIAENSDPSFSPSYWFDFSKDKDKKYKDIDNLRLASLVSEQVVDSCGYTLNYKGREGIEEFKEYFLSLLQE